MGKIRLCIQNSFIQEVFATSSTILKSYEYIHNLVKQKYRSELLGILPQENIDRIDISLSHSLAKRSVILV